MPLADPPCPSWRTDTPAAAGNGHHPYRTAGAGMAGNDDVLVRRAAVSPLAARADAAARRVGDLPPDQPDLIATIAQIVAEAVGTGCLIRPRSADGHWLEPGWIAHPDAAMVARALDLADRWPQRVDEGLSGHVVSRGEPFYARSFGEVLAGHTSHDGRTNRHAPSGKAGAAAPPRPEFRDSYALLAQSSLIMVPLHAGVGHGGSAEDGIGIFGTLGVTRDEPLSPFGLEDVATIQDLADRIAPVLRHGFLARRLREPEARYHELVEQGPGVAYVRGAQPGIPSYRQVYLVSPQVRTMLGFTPAEWLADPSLWVRAIHPEDRTRVLAEAEAIDATSEAFQIDYRVITRDRRVIWIRDEATLIRDDSGEPLSWCGVMTDVTATQSSPGVDGTEARRISEQRLLALVRHATDAICILAKDGSVTWASPSVERVLGWRPEEIAAGTPLLPHPDDLGLMGQTLGRVLLEPDRAVTVELRFQGRNGGDTEWRWVEAVHTNLLADPTVAGIVVNFHDISDRKVAEERLRWQAFHDPLTRLPNRTAFSEKLDALLTNRAKTGGAPVAVLMLDLDQFKRVNDGLGHAAGDLLLQQVAGRFTTVLRPGEFIARFGGDEFVAIVDTMQAQPEAAAERLISSLVAPFDLHGTEVRIDSSVGIARSSAVSTTAGDLLREADVALYQAKASGRGRAANFDAAMGVEVLTRLGLESDLRHAVERDELRLRFQPVIALASGALVGFEALVRWEHPVRGLVAPSEFLSLAEESGQITAIGEWVITNALAAAAGWPGGSATAAAPPPTAPGGLAGYPGFAARGAGAQPGPGGQVGQPGPPDPTPEPGRPWRTPYAMGQSGVPGQPGHPDQFGQPSQGEQPGNQPQFGPYGGYPPYQPYPPYPTPPPYGGHSPYPYSPYPSSPPFSPYAPPEPHAFPGYPPPPGHAGYPAFPPYGFAPPAGGYPGYPAYPAHPAYPAYPPHLAYPPATGYPGDPSPQAHPGSGPPPGVGAAGRRGMPPPRPDAAPVVMVNLSARQLRQPGLAGMISGLLRTHGIAPERLVLEVSGHTIMEAAGITAETLHILKATGVQLAIDDFGIDASALSLVRRLPFDGLKVDRSFVREIAMDWPSLSIVRTFVSLAHDLGLRVTAEGIETAAELGRLREMGCDYGQGYFLAPPLEPDEVTEYIRWVQR